MTIHDRIMAELVFELADIDPFTFGGGNGRACGFCGTYSRDTHYQWCIWKRAAALRWRQHAGGSP